MRLRKNLCRILVVAMVVMVGATACRRKPRGNSSTTGSAENSTAPTTGDGALVTSNLSDPSAAAAPLPPPDAQITVAVERRFLPAQEMNAYSPAQPGDYQAQLNLYNRVLRKRVQDLGNTPDTFEQLMASSGYPKPPQPPAGRKLNFDRRTVTVSVQ